METVHLLAAVAWLLLVAGWTARRRRRLHLSLVVPGILLDLAMVVALELERSVIEKTVSEPFTLPQQVHIGASLLAVLLYFPTVWLGLRLLFGRPDPRVRVRHRRFAVTALVLRTVGFAFMWSL